jgi:outer membrane receptor protein involved in Fe transport
MSINKYRQPQPTRLAFAVASITTLLAFASTPLQAQQPTEEIMVTGSRISRDVGFSSPVPVTAINTEELRMFDPGLGVSQQLENLPQFFNNVSSDNIANRVTADVGQSQLNMRGMGGNRTLVLLDGLRVVPSDRRSSVSVDYLPSTLMQRVDVVTGGASAAYGSDALAGVTNFVLNRNFTGLDIRTSTGINEEGDGEFNRASVTFGDDFLDDTLHVFGAAEVRVNDAFRRNNADWDVRQGYVMNPEWAAWRARTPATGPGAVPNSAAPVPLRLTRGHVYNNSFTNTGLIIQPGSALNRQQFTNDGTGVIPFQEGQFASIAGQASTLNSAQGAPGQYQYDEFVNGHPQSIERVGVKQQTLFVGGDYNLTENTTLWGHALYGRIHNDIEPSSSGASGTGLGHAGLAYLTAFRDNPFLPASVRQTMLTENRQSIRIDQHGFLGTEWGIREKPQVTNQMDSITLGFTTENLIGDWNLRGAYQTGNAKKKNMNNNWERLDRFYLALDAVTDPATGQPICRIKQVQQQLAAQGRNLERELGAWSQVNTTPSRYFFRGDLNAKTPGKLEPVPFPISVDSIDNTISDCVPVNMFGRGKQSDAAMDYIFSSRTKTGISTQEMDFAELLSSGTIMEGWAGPISGAVGLTWRDSSIKQIIVDDEIDALGAPCNVTLPDGTVAVRGVAPSINCSATADNLHRFSGQPEFMGGFDVKEFFAETIVPLYDNGTQNAEFNLAARYSDYSRAGEFTSWKAGLSLQVVKDLRLRGTYSHDIREGSFEELFVQQGRGANINDPVTGQTYTTFNLTGGNPDLEAEEADTTVLGFVYQPSWLEGLSLSLDRYDVELSSAIASFTEQQTVDECNRTGALCEYIIRGSDGFIQTIRVQFININQAKVSGYDGEISYRMEPDFFGNFSESMNFRLIAGYMSENSTTPLNSAKVDRAGADALATQGGGYLPQETLTANITYNIGDLGVSLQQTHQGELKRNALWVEGVDVDSNRIGSVNLTNLGLFWSRDLSSGSSWRASFNVTNLFNRDPVLAGTTRVGDDVGRRYALGFDYSF